MPIRRVVTIAFVAFAAVAILGVWVWDMTNPSSHNGTVYVDNASPSHLRVQLDGQQWKECAPGSQQTELLPPGRHTLTVVDADGKALDEVKVDVVARGKYVLNLLRAQQYHRGTVSYGTGSGRSGVDTSENWIDVTGVDHIFTEPPESVRVPSGQIFTSRTFLARGRVLAK